MSARGFYVITYILFYLAVYKYPNDFSDNLAEGAYISDSIFIAFQIISLYYFLTAGKNPGFVDETETQESREEKAKLFVGYDEFKTVENSCQNLNENTDIES